MINDPLTFFDVEFQIFDAEADGTYISQNVNSGTASRELQIASSNSSFTLIIGGAGTAGPLIVN